MKDADNFYEEVPLEKDDDEREKVMIKDQKDKIREQYVRVVMN
jgi:hypothetical protein